MHDLFARLVGLAAPVTPAGNPGNPDASGRGYRNHPCEINAVTPVTSVTPENQRQPHAHAPSPDQADLTDAFEERAAILEFDAGLSRAEAERRAWQEVFSNL